MEKPQQTTKTHSDFFVYNEYFGIVARDENPETTIIYGFENISDKNKHQRIFDIEQIGGCYGYVVSGSMIITERVIKNDLATSRDREIVAGEWFTTKDSFSGLLAENTRVAIFQRINYNGVVVKGELEDAGRLKYINGAMDTILYGPIKYGEPILNALFVPAGVHQTMHTHPSTRAGVIVSGNAYAETPEGKHELKDGSIFFLPKEGWHKFRTDHDGGFLKLVAYHPDSEFGAKDEDHPMLNRTIVDGFPANTISEIQTK